MRQSLLYASAVVSLLLCVVTAALWGRSHWATDVAGYQGRRDAMAVLSNQGRLTVHDDTLTSLCRGFGRPGWVHWHGPASPPTDWTASAGMRWTFHLLGFSAQARRDGSAMTGPGTVTFFWPYWQVNVPHPAVAALLAVLPAVAIQRFRAARLRPGHYRRCGYDLRGTPDRCPECGNASGRPGTA